MHSFEAGFKTQLEALDSDARTAATFAYTDFTLNHIAGGDTEVFDRLNLHPAFWNTVVGALQAAAFVSLGRIYDDDRQNYNAGQLLTYAETFRASSRRRHWRPGKSATGYRRLTPRFT